MRVYETKVKEGLKVVQNLIGSTNKKMIFYYNIIRNDKFLNKKVIKMLI